MDILEGFTAVWTPLFYLASWKTLFWQDMHNYDKSASYKQTSRGHSRPNKSRDRHDTRSWRQWRSAAQKKVANADRFERDVGNTSSHRLWLSSKSTEIDLHKLESNLHVLYVNITKK
jgi:hypothetical protein